MHMHQSTGPGARHRSASRQKKDRAIKFFSDMFGLQPLRNYVGKITFFEGLSGMMTTTAEEHGLLASLFMGSRQSRVAQDPRLEVVLPLLRERCQIFCAEDDAPPRYADEKQKVERELESISQTLSACLLNHIDTTFSDASFFHHLMPPGSRQPDPESRIEYDRQLDTRSTVQEIEVLQARLDEVRDDDEQRALEEDITGKILWFCWCGICAEVDQLLPQVVNYIRREGNMEGLREIYLAIRSLTDSADDQAHLQRIMFDAGAGTSKHQLLLDARAAEQAKWSGTSIPRGTISNGSQGTTPRTSSQIPSTSAV
ncbi:hypothetical protein M404DRAFT_767573 [Pisolithus tinctorius Marx 270]|uniref:Uncharacterized protein n=1 Tax=Pisolithus tinctorius Marx 270 TaxID=870435 RepID=A0A0C3NY86_PISTI|nr:hypothetical protein M404DRAFT_767573 [Pisolithus tinctorius Marx 270]